MRDTKIEPEALLAWLDSAESEAKSHFDSNPPSMKYIHEKALAVFPALRALVARAPLADALAEAVESVDATMPYQGRIARGYQLMILSLAAYNAAKGE